MSKEAEDAVNEHAQALLDHDIEALIDGYADDAVFFTGKPEPLVGKDAIAAMFRGVPEEALPTEVHFDILTSHGDYVFVNHHNAQMRGGDCFQIRDGKIVMQFAYVVH